VSHLSFTSAQSFGLFLTAIARDGGILGIYHREILQQKDNGAQPARLWVAPALFEQAYPDTYRRMSAEELASKGRSLRAALDSELTYKWDEVTPGAGVYSLLPKRDLHVFCTTITLSRESKVTVECDIGPIWTRQLPAGIHTLPTPHMWPADSRMSVQCADACCILTKCIPEQYTDGKVLPVGECRPCTQYQSTTLPAGGGRVDNYARLYAISVVVTCPTIQHAVLHISSRWGNILVGESLASGGQVRVEFGSPFRISHIDHWVIKATHVPGKEAQPLVVEVCAINFLLGANCLAYSA